MAKIRPPTQNNGGLSKVTTLVLGFVLGIAVMLVFSRDNYTDTTSDHLRKIQSGWNPVHVFFGKDFQLSQQYFAQVHQDQVVLDLVGSKGYFVDLAANDAQELSNTLALERAGWDGLCIEPNPVYWYGLSHRKCTVVGALVGASRQEMDVKFRGPFGGIVGKLDEKMANFKKEPKAPIEQRYTVPLLEILQKFNAPTTIDYLSLDVEGAELLVMQDFPFASYNIRIMTIERPSNDLRDLLAKQGFVFLKDLAWWGETLWAHKSTGLSPTHPKVVKIKTEERN